MFWLYIVIGVVLLFYIGFPLFIRQVLTVEANPFIEEIATDELDDGNRAYFEKVGNVFETNGFKPLGWAAMPSVVKDTPCITAVWHDPVNHMAAYAAVTIDPIKGVKQWVEIGCDLSGGTELLTNNSVDPINFPSVNHRVLNLPDCEDIGQLLRIHRRAVNDSGLATRPITASAVVDAKAMLREALYNENKRLQRDGYYQTGKEDDIHRLTLRGAYRATWLNLPPFKWLHKRRQLAQAKRVLDKYGDNG